MLVRHLVAEAGRAAVWKPPQTSEPNSESRGDRVGVEVQRGVAAGEPDRLGRSRGIGWDMVHLANDDHSRVSFALIETDERGENCAQLLREAVANDAALGVRIDRVMTDNGCGYVSKAFRAACNELGIRHVRTRPYTPETNGKAERFVRTSLREWAYAQPYASSAQREAALKPFLHRPNWHRPHSALNRRPPMSRIPAVSKPLELNTWRGLRPQPRCQRSGPCMPALPRLGSARRLA